VMDQFFAIQTPAPTPGASVAPTPAPTPWTGPTITLHGEAVVELPILSFEGTRYDDPGAMCVDPMDGNLDNRVIATGDLVNLNLAGKYEIVYLCINQKGVDAPPVTRQVSVVLLFFPVCSTVRIQEDVITKTKRGVWGHTTKTVVDDLHANKAALGVYRVDKHEAGKRPEYVQISKSKAPSNSKLSLLQYSSGTAGFVSSGEQMVHDHRFTMWFDQYENAWVVKKWVNPLSRTRHSDEDKTGFRILGNATTAEALTSGFQVWAKTKDGSMAWKSNTRLYATCADFPCVARPWSPFSHCSVSCGGGLMTQTRATVHKDPVSGRASCRMEVHRHTCNPNPCVDPKPCQPQHVVGQPTRYSANCGKAWQLQYHVSTTCTFDQAVPATKITLKKLWSPQMESCFDKKGKPKSGFGQSPFHMPNLPGVTVAPTPLAATRFPTPAPTPPVLLPTPAPTPVVTCDPGLQPKPAAILRAMPSKNPPSDCFLYNVVNLQCNYRRDPFQVQVRVPEFGEIC
jgi:hypothetical protein